MFLAPDVRFNFSKAPGGVLINHQHLKSMIAISLVVSIKMLHYLFTRPAPGSPKVDQQGSILKKIMDGCLFTV